MKFKQGSDGFNQMQIPYPLIGDDGFVFCVSLKCSRDSSDSVCVVQTYSKIMDGCIF